MLVTKHVNRIQIRHKVSFISNWGAAFVYLGTNFELLCITAHWLLTIVAALLLLPAFSFCHICLSLVRLMAIS